MNIDLCKYSISIQLMEIYFYFKLISCFYIKRLFLQSTWNIHHGRSPVILVCILFQYINTVFLILLLFYSMVQ